VITWLYVHDGKEPFSPQEIENAYRKFIPKNDWPKPSSDPDIYPARFGTAPPSPPLYLSGQEPINEFFTRALCLVCHTIPEIPGAEGIVGPKLTMKTTALERLTDPEYKGTATNVREYIIESILNPSVYVVKGYRDYMMPRNYREILSDTAVARMEEYLSQLEEGHDPPKAQ
ncbi:MAG TPA: nitric oxide reductase, partial [Nitrospiraceae bacterium]|nr:nitric oxide reductase [Nitrospiraceae bacterium]